MDRDAENKQVLYFPGLNGIRAIAAMAVLFAHITLSLNEFGLNKFVFGKLQDGTPGGTVFGGFGVSMFFSLSGFLITYLLLAEKATGKINIGNFYIRRVLRIWPLYFLYLAVVILTLYVTGTKFIESSILYYVLLLANIPFIFNTAIPFIGHYWSLGVEEQFYLFWPVIVSKVKNLLRFSSVAVVLLILLKLVFRYIDFKYNRGGLYHALHVTRFHCMLIGAIGAIGMYQDHKLLIRLLGSIYAQLAAWVIIVLLFINRFHIASVIDNEIVSLATVVIIFGQIQKKNEIINLDNRPFNFLGKISFGIYIIHPILIFYISKVYSNFFETGWINYMVVYILISSVTILTAFVSYTFFESVFLRLKNRFTKIKSSSSK